MASHQGMTRVSSIMSLAVALATASCSDSTRPVVRGTGPGVGGAGGNGTTTSAAGGAGAGDGMGGAGGEIVGGPQFAVCDDPPAGYPSGPYGNEVGDTLALLDLQGWANTDGEGLANEEPFGPFGTEAIRSVGTTHVMLHLAATW